MTRWDYGGGGLLYSQDAGGSWQIACNRGLDPTLVADTNGLAITPHGEVFTGDFKGMWRVAPGGCGAVREPAFEGLWVSDILHDPSDPETIYAVTSSGSRDNGIYAYEGEAGTWTPLGTSEPLLIGRLRVAVVDDGLRFYESVAQPGGRAEGGPALRYSDDAGKTWTTHPFPPAMAGTLSLEGVDPTHPDRIVVSEKLEDGPTGDAVLWVNDKAGDPEAYERLADVTGLAGLTFAPDGRMWFGNNRSTILAVASAGDTPVEVGDELHPRCVHYDVHTDTLLACRLLDVVAVDATGNVTPRLRLKTVEAWAECDGREPTAQLCEPQLATAAWCGSTHYPETGICEAYCYPGLNGDVAHSEGECPPETQFPEPEPEVTRAATDAGVTQASDTEAMPEMSLDPADAGTSRTKAPAHDSSGCRAGAEGRTTQGGIAWLLLVLALWVERRRHGSVAMRQC